MATPRVDRAAELVDRLKAAGLTATVDPTAAAASAPSVLVPPPVVGPGGTGAGPFLTWGLILLSPETVGGAKAWADLDGLLDVVWTEFSCTRADPVSYALTDGSSHPAYRVTIEE
jgi:hypothetical protein